MGCGHGHIEPCTACCEEQELITLRQHNDALRKFAQSLEWLDGHGCVTGDCPHEIDAECAQTLRAELERIAVEARAVTCKKTKKKKNED